MEKRDAISWFKSENQWRRCFLSGGRANSCRQNSLCTQLHRHTANQRNGGAPDACIIANHVINHVINTTGLACCVTSSCVVEFERRAWKQVADCGLDFSRRRSFQRLKPPAVLLQGVSLKMNRKNCLFARAPKWLAQSLMLLMLARVVVNCKIAS